MTSVRNALAVASLLLTAESCSFAPRYAQPAAPVPAAFKEVGPWAPAQPADTAPRGDWWNVFGDDKLSELERELDRNNPSLGVALSRHDQAESLLTQAQSSLVPELDFGGNLTRNRQSEHRPLRSPGSNFYGNNLLDASISYEFDFWGRVRNEVAAAKAGAQASNDDVASARLSLEAKLADIYFNLRGLDSLIRVLEDTAEAYTRAFRLTELLHLGGAATGLDVGRAQTQLSRTQAQISDVQAQRALREHQIASLVGEPASAFTVAPTAALSEPPVVPVTTPSNLLQRRPDIAAAERRAAQANAQIGVAKAAFFPTITLDATGGLQTSSNRYNLFSLANSFWTLGPAFAMTVFDGGRRQAVTQSARDQFDIASATYRETVLHAFQEVEDNLALSNRLADEAKSQTAAVDAANHVESLALKQYRLGAVTYLEVVTAQTAALQARRDAISVATQRYSASVGLIRALGGGWKSPNASDNAEASQAATAQRQVSD